MSQKRFHNDLKLKMHQYVKVVYKISRTFPKEELYGVTAQLRRASLSVILNYIEGFARMRSKVYKNFLETSYGSLKESKYLLYFSMTEGYLNRTDYQNIVKLSEDIGAMLWGIIKRL